MILLVLSPQITAEEIEQICDFATLTDGSARVHDGGLITVSGSEQAASVFEELSGVDLVGRISADYPRASLPARRGAYSTVRFGAHDAAAATIGPAGFTVIAGPCSVESRDQLVTTAEAVRAAGCHALRGGAYKPRTSPYAFQGLGRPGLALLAEARAETGLPVVTEVLDIRELEAIAEAVDMIQIGARNMQNFALLREVGRMRLPVLLKRGLAATVDETILAAEYILDGGNPDVVLCERGIRTFEGSYRFTLDLTAIPVFRERTHLPVIVDPSHAAGQTSRVIPLALAAAAAGADGIIVESHCDPASARCDGAQALPVERLHELVSGVRLASSITGRTLWSAPALAVAGAGAV